MNRRSKGALIGKITASILASSFVFSSSLPVRAADSDQLQNTDTALKTLPPQEEAPASTSSQSSTLKFTSEPATADNAGAGKPAAQEDTKDSWTAPPPVASAQPAGSKTAATTDSDATTPSDNSAVAVAPPEVTDPQPLPAAGKDGSKELAQSLPNRPRVGTDPYYRKLPTHRGDVVLHHPFDKFPSNTIVHNLAFRDTPVKEVVAEIAKRGNLNVILDRSVIGHITGDLHDMTLNEAMETVLSSTGLQYRQLDNSTVIIGQAASLARLGLNRPKMRVFKLSYLSPFDAATLLYCSVFNKGYIPDFTLAVRSRYIQNQTESPVTQTQESVNRAGTAATASGTETSASSTTSRNGIQGTETQENGDELATTNRLDAARIVRGSVRENLLEGSGFNSGAQDPGSQTIRAVNSVLTDFNVEQNGGGAIVIPDQKNRQLIICGTQEDIDVADEALHLIDRRPKQIHIQSSLIEIQSNGIRQLGASLNLQGAGASGTLLGGAGAPLVNFLPGLGTLGSSTSQTGFTNAAGTLSNLVTSNIVGINPVAQVFSQTTPVGTFTRNIAAAIAPTVLNGNGFTGNLGALLPGTQPSIASVNANASSVSGFNFLTLNKAAGGRANIATMPFGANISLNLALQSGKAKILANPSVQVEDNTETLITLANEVIHKVTTTVSLGVVSTNVELVKAGIFLDVLPKISEDGFISMRLRPQVSSPLGPVETFANGTVLITLLDVRDIMVQEVRVKDGQTLVIGGLFTEQEASTMSKVPYLSEAPILGALFRNTVKGRNRTETMLLITPKIVEEPPPSTLSENGGPTPAL